MAKQIILYPRLRRYLQGVKTQNKLKYTQIADSMNLHVNVIQSWFWGTRFPRASNILPLSIAISKDEEEAKIIAFKLLEIASDE